jgi:large subunit ribosomal protein L25
MEVVAVQGQIRENLGKSGAKATRRNENIPCVLYGGNENIHFSASFKDVRHLIYTPAFKLAEISIDGNTYRAILKEVQFHPVSEEILHIDFLRLIENHRVKVDIPVRLTGTAAGVKTGGVLQQLLRKVKVITTPEHLVNELLADVSHLELGQSVRVKDIATSEEVQIINNPNVPIGIIETPRALRSATSAMEKLEEEEGEEEVTAPETE